MKGLRRPEIGEFTIVCIFASIFLSSIKPIANLDIWWHLATGRYILSSNSIPTYDIFSHTAAGEPWIDHAWLAQILFYETYSILGYLGLVLLKSILVVLVFYLIFKRLSATVSQAASIVFMLIIFGAIHNLILLRPFLLTWLFVAYFIYVLEAYVEGRTDERHLYLLPITTLLWANLHGGFILGIVLTMIYATGSAFSEGTERAKRLFYIAFICTAASLFNPNTYHLLVYPFQYVSETVHAMFISEWQSPSFHSFGLYEALLLLMITSLALYRGVASATDLLPLLIFTHLSLFSIRNIPIFAIVCGPIIARYSEASVLEGSGLLEAILVRLNLEREKARLLIDKFVPAFLWTAVLLSVMLFAYAYSTSETAFQTGPSEALPEEAASFLLESNLEGNLYNSYGWGGYLIWRLYPEYKIFIDGRADLYGDFIYEYIKVSRIEPEVLETLEKYEISIIFIPREQALNVFLRESPYWEVKYQDDTAVIYVRAQK